jgi:signal peptidase II
VIEIYTESMRLPRLTLAVAALVVIIDAISKALVSHLLVAGRVVRVGPLLELDLYRNHAGSRNILTGDPVLFSLFAIVVVSAIAVMATRLRGTGALVGLGLLLGGGLGNLLDRLFGAPGPLRGGVIDWLRPLGSSGSMNLADASITIGLTVLAITALWHWWIERRTGDGEQRLPRLCGYPDSQ